MRSWISSHPAVHEATSAWVSSCSLPSCSMTGLLSAFPVMEPHHTTNRNCKSSVVVTIGRGWLKLALSTNKRMEGCPECVVGYLYICGKQAVEVGVCQLRLQLKQFR